MPKAFPTRLTVRLTTREATNGGDSAPEGEQGQGVGIGVGTVSDNLDQDGLHDLTGQEEAWRGVFLIPAVLTIFLTSWWYLLNRPALHQVEPEREKITDIVPKRFEG